MNITISGYAKDEATGQPLPGASAYLVDQNLTPTGIGIAANAQGYFEFTADVNFDFYLVVSSVGYRAKAIPGDVLTPGYVVSLVQSAEELPPVIVSTTKTLTNTWLFLLPLLLLLPNDRKKVSGKTEPVNPNTLFIIGGGIIGLTFLQKLLTSFGLFPGEGAAAEHAAQSDPGSCWKPTYWQNAPAGARLLTVDDATNAARTIYHAFTLFKDDYAAIMGIFSQLVAKSQVSFLADQFQKQYNTDLLGFLHDGGGVLPWDGLSDAHMKELLTFVDRLTNY